MIILADEEVIKSEDLYNINPDDLESGFLEVSKLFFKLAGTTAKAYIGYLIAKNEVKRISAKVFLDIKKDPEWPKVPSDAVAKEGAQVNDAVVKAHADLISKTQEFERMKAAKDSLLTKKEMLSAISYVRKTDYELSKETN